MPTIVRQAGQQTTEFALLLGVAAVAIISLQFIAERAVRAGVMAATDVMLGVPDPADDDDPTRELDVHVASEVTEQGDASFQRVTKVNGTLTGHTVDEDVRIGPVVPVPAPRHHSTTAKPSWFGRIRERVERIIGRKPPDSGSGQSSTTVAGFLSKWLGLGKR